MPRWLFLLIGLAIAPVGYYVGMAFVRNRLLRAVGAALLAVMVLGCLREEGRQIAAFTASIVFPLAGFLVLDTLRPRNPLLGFLLVSGFSIVGGLCVAGLLNALPYFIRADVFPGVKISVFLPILLVGAYYIARLADVRSVLRTQITWGTAFLGLAIIAGLGFMVLRTGNESPAGASGPELLLRKFLDEGLFVRPRTKEFFVGHPLLIIGIGMLSRLRRGRGTGDGDGLNPQPSTPIPLALGPATAVALALGAMGQTSIVNTLCHLHTPIMLSIARVGIGLVMGSILGLVLWAVIGGVLKRVSP